MWLQSCHPTDKWYFFRLKLPYFDRTKRSLLFVVCCHWLWLFMKCVSCIVLFIPFLDTKRISINCCHFQVESLFLESWIKTKSDLKISKLCLHTTRNFSSSMLFASVINYKQFSIVSLLRLLLKNWSISLNHCERDHNIFARVWFCQTIKRQKVELCTFGIIGFGVRAKQTIEIEITFADQNQKSAWCNFQWFALIGTWKRR